MGLMLLLLIDRDRESRMGGRLKGQYERSSLTKDRKRIATGDDRDRN